MDNQNERNRNANLPATSQFGTIFPDLFDSDNLWGLPSLFNASSRRTLPAVNVKETDKDYEIEMAVPGIPKENIHVDVEENMLIVRGENTTNNNEQKEEGRYTRREFSHSSFERRFTLPESADVDKIHATCNNGVVDIQIPKIEEKKIHRREINIS